MKDFLNLFSEVIHFLSKKVNFIKKNLSFIFFLFIFIINEFFIGGGLEFHLHFFQNLHFPNLHFQFRCQFPFLNFVLDPFSFISQKMSEDEKDEILLLSYSTDCPRENTKLFQCKKTLLNWENEKDEIFLRENSFVAKIFHAGGRNGQSVKNFEKKKMVNLKFIFCWFC